MKSIQTIAWPSHERHEVLTRSVTSFLKNLNGEDVRQYRFIFALSGTNQHCPDLPIPRENILLMNDEYRERICHFFSKSLKEKNISSHVIDFGLKGTLLEGTEGVHRNNIMLATLGDYSLWADDDIIFDIKELDKRHTQNSQIENTNFYTFNNYQELQAFSNEMKSISLKDFLHTHSHSLRSSVFSSPGIRGDSSYGGAKFIFTFSESELLHFSKTENFSSDFTSKRIIWREISTTQNFPYRPIATYTLGVNNKYLLPPCFPFGRNLDGAFTFATKVLYPQSQTSLIKGSILHIPHERRLSYPDLDTFSFRINDFIWLTWNNLVRPLYSKKTPQESFLIASQHFKEIASLTNSQFTEFYIKFISTNLKNRKTYLEDLIKKFQGIRELSHWALLAQNEINLCNKVTSLKELNLPLENADRNLNAIERVELTKEWLHSYGELLSAWPLIRETAENNQHIFRSN